MQCPNCQNTVPDTANVCGYCGTRLRAPAPVQPLSQPVTPPQPVQTPSPPVAPVYIPPVSPAPVAQRKKLSIWAWIFGIFLCLGVTLVLIWAVFFSNININFGPTQPTYPPTISVQSQPQSTPIPPEPTSVVEPTKTTAPPKPTAVTLPNGISTFLLRTKILEHDPFSTRDPAWVATENGLKWTNETLEMTGTDGFATSFSRGTLEKGQALLFLMEYTTADMDLNFLIEKGEWQTSNYYRYGVNLKREAKTDIWKGTNYLGDAKFIGNLQFEVGKDYYFLLALDGEQEFAAFFWEATNPGTYTMIRQGQVKDWPASGWTIVVQANAGVIKFDEFFLLQFDEFAF